MPVSSKMKWVVFTFLFCCAVCLVIPASLAGQSTSTGTVVGLVTDETDAPVVGATVSLVDHSTGTTKGTITNDVGRYVFVNVNPGMYDIQVEKTVSSLLTLQPGIAPNGSVAGAVRDQNTFQLDGGNNSSDMDGTMNTYTPSFASAASSTAGGGPTGVMPTPVESIEEFKVNVSNQT